MVEGNEKFDFDGLFILEMANNHGGSVEHGKRIMEAYAPIVARAGVRAAIKFQLRDLDTFIHPAFKNSAEYKHIPRFLSTRLSDEQFKELIDKARELDFYVMATPFDEASVDTIERLGVDVIKVASSSSADWPLLEKISQAGKPVVASTGGLATAEVDNLVSFFEHRGVDFAIMHCVSRYPTPLHEANLRRIRMFTLRYPSITIGYSTHEDPGTTDGIKVSYSLGARIFEKHIGLPQEGVSLNAYSASPEQFERWLNAYHDVVTMIGDESSSYGEKDNEVEKEELRLQMRGLYAKRPIAKGQVITRDDVFFAMPLQVGQVRSGRWRVGLVADNDYASNDPISEGILPTAISKKYIIYRVVHEVKGILRSANIPVTTESSVTLQHPFGIETYFSAGFAYLDVCMVGDCMKRLLVFLSGQMYPKHYHTKQERILQVLSGEIIVDLDGREKTLYSGDTILIPGGVWHAFKTLQKNAVVEELSPLREGDHIHFVDKEIDRKSKEERETKLIYWGRHQFDAEP